MTEASFHDGGCLVRVRAQVMTRDGSTGGWVPLGGGGLISVSVRKHCDLQPNSATPGPRACCYQITGEREARVLLSCAIGRDFTYNKVMPTFHHWCTREHKFGLTFQTSADARAFDKVVRILMEDLLDGTVTLANTGAYHRVS
ncbi:sprouty-related, EVH1 domain-containing protein 1 [Rhipicephalus microplus]|uniref:sprouty-related, EVH1 domain-containing protein 1 n=1 Tax=Rhipicephalus microplus TaxID=6941 RepID=UPI003F6BBCD0